MLIGPVTARSPAPKSRSWSQCTRELPCFAMAADDQLYVFPDANVLLQFRRLDQGNWKHEFRDQPVEILVATSVVSEVDKKKTSPSLRLRKRARDLLPWLLEIEEAGNVLANGFTMRFVPGTPVSELEAGNLDRNNPDDVLVAYVLAFIRKNPDKDVLLLADDTGLVLKARGFGLRAERPSDSLSLPAEETEEERELRNLRQKVERLELGAPQLRLEGSGNPIRVSVTAVPSEEAYVAARLEEEIGELNAGVTEDARAEYLPRFESWAREFYPHHIAFLRHFYLRLVLVNAGRGPADDIDLFLELPNDTRFEGSGLSDTPQKPERPQPTGVYELRFPESKPIEESSSLFPREQEKALKWRFPDHRAARIHLPQLKHHLEQVLPRLSIWFDGAPKDFGIDWKAVVANSPDPFKCRLNVVVDETRTENELWEEMRGER